MWRVVDWSLSAGLSELERQLDGDKQIGRSDGFLGIVNFYSGRQGGLGEKDRPGCRKGQTLTRLGRYMLQAVRTDVPSLFTGSIVCTVVLVGTI